MLTWHEEKGKYLGFDDDTFIYRVAYDDGYGWYYEHVLDRDGMDGYDTAEEAMAAADAEYSKYEAEMRHLLEIDEPLSYEEAMEILGDMMYEERKEEGLF